MQKTIILFLALSVTGILPGSAKAAQPDGTVNYEIFAAVLEEYVDDKGMVDYARLKENTSALDRFVHQIENADITDFSANEKKAFWINAYNALTLQLIVDKYPLLFGGIRTINWGRPWSIKMKAAGRDLTLGEIEHEILRKWDPIDPRIHFAINCASIGCPVLPQEPFWPENLDEQLDRYTRAFADNPDKVRLDREENILYYSAIFKWFKEDFLVKNETIVEYIKRYINAQDRRYLENNDVKTKVLRYDWGLNDING